MTTERLMMRLKLAPMGSSPRVTVAELRVRCAHAHVLTVSLPGLTWLDPAIHLLRKKNLSRRGWTRGSSPIGANLSLATNLSLVIPRFKRGTQ
jgi:hypothetical protein